ncbi:MAG TPA: carboxypeptidase-like regulatory domain-containing protein, partial [Planctomycetota bacterium]|nr:carboxypeptidase-like regulatory domain-containing protein [Planctomycetota bacterium]
CRATGRVVDAQTQEPIPGSSVLLYMNRGNQYLQPRHMPVVVDAQGRFELDGLAPGDNRLVVEAPGYSRYLGVAFGSADRVADVGSISMQRTRALELALLSQGPLDFGSFTATLKGTRYHDPTTFSVDGVARFNDVSPGIVTWEIHGPSGFFRREIHMLQPDVEWVFEVDVDVGPVLEIQVVSPGRGEVPRDIEMTVFGSAPRGLNVPGMEAIARVTADEEGLAIVRGLQPGPVAIEAFSPDGTEGAAASGILEEYGSRIEVVWSMQPHTFRVVDASGQGVSEADVFLFTSEGGSTWNAMNATDISGEVTFYVFPQDDILVGVKHPELGMLPARPLRLSQESGKTTLRYGDVSGLDLLLLEGGAPSTGTQVSLFTGGFRFVVGDIASDGEGRLRWPNLAEGTYSMRVVHPGFWPGHAQVPTASGSEPTPVTIYRTGSAVLKLVTGSSTPLAGQALELEHVALGEGPAHWAALGLLPSADTVSDGQGRIVLDGWPRGAYRWRAERPDGSIASGDFELAVGANPEIELRLP